MTRNTDPSDWEARFRALQRKVDQLARQTQLANASVTRGRVRIASAEGLVVEGSARISGVLNGDGSMSWTGPVEFVGPVTITGNVTRSGTENATGATTLNGLTTINGDLIVNSSSQMTVNGPLEIRGATDITGNATVDGLLTVNGDAIFNTSSNMTVNGPLNVKGTTTISGATNMNGQTTVQGDLDVTGGGTIQAGAVTVSPANGGQINVGQTTLQSDGSLVNSDATYGIRMNRASVTDMATLTPLHINQGAYPVWSLDGGQFLLDRNNVAP